MQTASMNSSWNRSNDRILELSPPADGTAPARPTVIYNLVKTLPQIQANSPRHTEEDRKSKLVVLTRVTAQMVPADNHLANAQASEVIRPRRTKEIGQTPIKGFGRPMQLS